MAVHVVGGRVFGYRNVDVIIGQDARGRSLRSHVERVSDEAEAAVVVRIFELFAEGYGLKRIAKVLTADGAVASKPFVRKDSFGLPPGRRLGFLRLCAACCAAKTIAAFTCGTKRRSAMSGAR